MWAQIAELVLGEVAAEAILGISPANAPGPNDVVPGVDTHSDSHADQSGHDSSGHDSGGHDSGGDSGGGGGGD